jgi:hypothetical protein
VSLNGETNKISPVLGRTPTKAGGGLLAAGLAVAALAALLVQPQPARGFELGLTDPVFADPDAATRTTWLDRAGTARAGLILIAVGWETVAPDTPPPGFNAANPADPAYDWTRLDHAVLDATARGFRVAIIFTRAPRWAEGPGRPSFAVAPDGSWMPNAAHVGDFTRAIATRYSGQFMGLPAVRHWQLWAEPNLGINLSPQFIGKREVGHEVYRPMLDSFYANLKAVSPQNQVITGGTAPYGGLTPASGLAFQRMQPLTFWRGLLCLQPRKKGKKGRKKRGRRTATLAAAGCTPPRFDIAAHHPINVGAPTRHAINPDDASTPDIGKVRRVIRAAVGNKPIWGTEIWWNSNPPGRGVPLKTQARYLSQSFYILWKQGVPVVVWFEIRDLQPVTGHPIPTSGIFFRDGRPKPAFQAFRFPFAVERLSRSRVRVWGMAPGPGPVSIETRRGRRVKTLAAGGDRVFVGVIRFRRNARLRATQGSESSLVAPEFTTKKRR